MEGERGVDQGPRPPLLEMRGITRRFPGVLALDRADLGVQRGEVHALMGQNGAGKSTLVKVLTGVLQADSGSITFEGRPVRPAHPAHAQRLGIGAVFQEIDLIGPLSVAENLYLGRQPMRGLLRIDWRAIRRGAREALRRLDIDVDPSAPVFSLPIALRQMVAIARALAFSARLLVLDEPTSCLDEAEARRLFGVMRRLKGEGIGIVFVTHFIEQMFQIADRVSVLRDGRLVGCFDVDRITRVELVNRMLGRSDGTVEAPVAPSPHARAASAPAAPETAPLLEARGLGRRRALEPLDLTIRAGQIVGLAGLLGSGRTEAARLLFGLDRADRGATVRVRGRAVRLRSPRSAIALGFAFVPEDRLREGIVPHLSIEANIVLALQARRGWLRPLGRRRSAELARTFAAALRIDSPGLDRPVRLLSGGNQQKAVLARWLATAPALLILDEPTRGIDVGTKAEIEKIVHSLAADGTAIVLISCEIEEVARSCCRIVVLRDRRKVGEIDGPVPAGDLVHLIAKGSSP